MKGLIFVYLQLHSTDDQKNACLGAPAPKPKQWQNCFILAQNYARLIRIVKLLVAQCCPVIIYHSLIALLETDSTNFFSMSSNAMLLSFTYNFLHALV